MVTRRLIALALAIPLLLPGCAGVPTNSAGPSPSRDGPTPSTSAAAAPHPFAGDQSWIAYQTNRGGSEGVWLIHPDGSDDHEIATDFPGDVLLPSWSPDGRRLTMTTRGTGGPEPIIEYDVERDTWAQLFPCEDPCLGDDEPAYSPDGSKVAVVRALGPFSNGSPSDCALWIGDLALGTIEQLTSTPGCAFRESLPLWSHDGSRLAYYRGVYTPEGVTSTAIYALDLDTLEERKLTEDDMFAGTPDWSADDEWIVFSTYPLNDFQCCQVSNLYRIHPDGSGMEALTDYSSADLRATQPRFTPKGDWIVFTAVKPSSRSLWAIPSEGGEPVVIAAGGIYTHGVWQP